MPSFWELDSFYAPRDVIIVGSGFAGLWSAWHLKKLRPNWNILIIEKSISPNGASTRNAGFACFGSPTELIADLDTFGEQSMLDTFAMRFEGIRRLLETVSAEEIDYEALGGYEVVTADQYKNSAALTNDLDRLNELLRPITGSPKLFKLADEKLPSFEFSGFAHLVENDLEGQLHPGKLVSALTRLLANLGVEVLRGTELHAYKTFSDHVELNTNQPVPFYTGNLLICTNTDPGQLTQIEGVQPARGQVLLTSPIKGLPFRGSFHYDQGFYYFRNLGDRVLLGGARNKAFDDESTHDLSTSLTIQDELERFLKEHLLPNHQYSIEQRWSGTMGMSPTKSSIVKTLKERCYCALTLGGIGVAIAPLAGEQAAHLLAENDR